MPLVSESYRVQLDVFTGPLDLLLYLIRRDELDIQDIAIARIAGQYLDHVRLLEQLDPNAAGEFLVMASTLLEIKSRALLPTPPIETADDATADPRANLVRQLLEYKRFKDAARSLGSAAEERGKRYIRRPADLPKELVGVELEEAQVWDLLDAFGKVMTAIGKGPSRHEVIYDDAPLELCAAEILAILEQEGAMNFEALFDGESSRSAVIGRFLALLELIRARRVRAEQDRNFGRIYLFLLEEVDDAGAADEAQGQLVAPAGPAPEGAVWEQAPEAPDEADRGPADLDGTGTPADETESGPAGSVEPDQALSDEATTADDDAPPAGTNGQQRCPAAPPPAAPDESTFSQPETEEPPDEQTN